MLLFDYNDIKTFSQEMEMSRMGFIPSAKEINPEVIEKNLSLYDNHGARMRIIIGLISDETSINKVSISKKQE